jgi:hypothetical protein
MTELVVIATPAATAKPVLIPRSELMSTATPTPKSVSSVTPTPIPTARPTPILLPDIDLFTSF